MDFVLGDFYKLIKNDLPIKIIMVLVLIERERERFIFKLK